MWREAGRDERNLVTISKALEVESTLQTVSVTDVRRAELARLADLREMSQRSRVGLEMLPERSRAPSPVVPRAAPAVERMRARPK